MDAFEKEKYDVKSWSCRDLGVHEEILVGFRIDELIRKGVFGASLNSKYESIPNSIDSNDNMG